MQSFLRDSFIDLTSNEIFYSSAKIQGSLSRVKGAQGFNIQEAHIAIIRGKTAEGMEYLRERELSYRKALEENPNDLKNIANLMVLILGAGKTEKEFEEFHKLKQRFLEKSQETQTPKPTTHITGESDRVSTISGKTRI